MFWSAREQAWFTTPSKLLGARHYKGSWVDDDHELYKYHIFRIYDVLVTEEAYVRLDYKLAEMYREIADERKGETLSSREFAWELGKRLEDENSILRAAYETNVPVFIPAVRDSEFGFIHWLHSSQKDVKDVLTSTRLRKFLKSAASATILQKMA